MLIYIYIYSYLILIVWKFWSNFRLTKLILHKIICMAFTKNYRMLKKCIKIIWKVLFSIYKIKNIYIFYVKIIFIWTLSFF